MTPDSEGETAIVLTVHAQETEQAVAEMPMVRVPEAAWATEHVTVSALINNFAKKV
jgi:hypothetical protein